MNNDYYTNMKSYSNQSILSFFFIGLFIIFTTLNTHSQAVWESYTSVSDEGNATATINVPSGTVDGDLLVTTFVEGYNSNTSATGPGGWTELITEYYTGNNLGIVVFYRIASSEPASYDFSATNASGSFVVTMARISNVNTSNPIDVSSGNSGVSSTSAVAPSITTTNTSDLVLCFYGNHKNTSFSAASGTTEKLDIGYDGSGSKDLTQMISTFETTSAGATGNKTAASAIAGDWVAAQIAINPDVIAPIELLNFNGLYNSINKTIELNWQTATEENNDYFTIEQSDDGINWNIIETIEGAGNSSIIKSYRTIDNNTYSKISYYRLKQTDYDGKYTYSEIISVKIDNSSSIDIFPNPTSNNIVISGEGILYQDVKIYNVLGKDVSNFAKATSISDNSISFDLTELPTGVYFVKTNNITKKIYKN